MRRRHAITLIAAAVSLAAASLAGAAGREADAIWIVKSNGDTARSDVVMSFGESFKAGYSSRAKEPWAFAQCWANSTTVLGTPNQGTYRPGDVIWSAYLSLTGLTGDTFLLRDPIQGLWLGGGADCKLSLVAFTGNKQSTLATTAFTVSG